MTEPQCPQKSPYVQMDVKPGEYAWCACGRSKSQPFCDGSHAGTGIEPKLVTIEQPGKVAWCGCKRSANGARCDGTHKKLT